MQLLNQLEQLVGGSGAIEHRCQHLTEDELADAFQNWLASNDQAWCAVDQMDASLLVEPLLKARDVEIDIRMLLATTPRDHHPLFWQIVCVLGRRNVAEIRAAQLAELNDAIDQFVAGLGALGVVVNRNDLVTFVEASRPAIEQRNLKLLSLPLDIPGDCIEIFWQHMQNCFNLLHPYDQIKQSSPDAGDKFVNKIMDVVGSFGSNPEQGLDIGSMLQQITGDTGFMQDMAGMFGASGGSFDPAIIGQVMGKFTKALSNLPQ